MNTITYIYQEVSIKGKKLGKCKCGKRLSRKNTFTQTINPFNKNNDGEVKNRSEILVELQKEREEWMKEEVNHHYPSYWGWSEEDREKYDNGEEISIKMDCGEYIKLKKKLLTNSSTLEGERSEHLSPNKENKNNE